MYEVKVAEKIEYEQNQKPLGLPILNYPLPILQQQSCHRWSFPPDQYLHMDPGNFKSQACAVHQFGFGL